MVFFIFYTKNIDQRLYKGFITRFIIQTIPRNKYFKTKDWVIKLYPSELAVNDPNFHGTKGIGGVTGKGEIKLYINDKKDSDLYLYLRENMVAISHELCHMIGIVLDWYDRVPLRNNDYSGHKAGTVLNKYVQEVHDRHVEGRFWTMSIKRFNYIKIKWEVVHARVLDIRDAV